MNEKRKPNPTDAEGRAGSEETPDDGRSSLDRLAELTRRVLKVPKERIKKHG